MGRPTWTGSSPGTTTQFRCPSFAHTCTANACNPTSGEPQWRDHPASPSARRWHGVEIKRGRHGTRAGPDPPVRSSVVRLSNRSPPRARPNPNATPTDGEAARAIKTRLRTAASTTASRVRAPRVADQRRDRVGPPQPRERAGPNQLDSPVVRSASPPNGADHHRHRVSDRAISGALRETTGPNQRGHGCCARPAKRR